MTREPRDAVLDCKCLFCGHVWVEDGFDAMVKADSRRIVWVMAGLVGFALAASWLVVWLQ